MCNFRCLVVDAGLVQTLALDVDLLGRDADRLADPAAGHQGQPERQRGRPVLVISRERLVGGRDFGLVQEGMALVLRAPANAAAGIALDLAVVFEPGHECAQHAERAVGVDRRRFRNTAVPELRPGCG